MDEHTAKFVDNYSENRCSILLKPVLWPSSYIENWKSSICFERNLTPRFKRTLNFDSAHCFRSNIEDVAQTIFPIFFSFKKTLFLAHFNGKFPALYRSLF